MPTHAVRTTKLDLRLSPQAKQTLSAAASALQRSVSQFVLESALARAEETLPDRQRFELNAAQWEAFMAALDGSPGNNPRLRRLMREPSIFEAPTPA